MFRILIAEDDLDTQQLFAHVLSKNGYHVKTVSTGQEAPQVLIEEYCDLIISDIMMPGMDGYELIQSIRAANIHTCQSSCKKKKSILSSGRCLSPWTISNMWSSHKTT